MSKKEIIFCFKSLLFSYKETVTTPQPQKNAISLWSRTADFVKIVSGVMFIASSVWKLFNE